MNWSKMSEIRACLPRISSARSLPNIGTSSPKYYLRRFQPHITIFGTPVAYRARAAPGLSTVRFDYSQLKQANRDCYKRGYLIMNEEDELPEVDGEQELPTCHDCDYWNEMIASRN